MTCTSPTHGRHPVEYRGEDCPMCVLVSDLQIRLDYLERTCVSISAHLDGIRALIQYAQPPSVQRREVTRG